MCASVYLQGARAVDKSRTIHYSYSVLSINYTFIFYFFGTYNISILLYTHEFIRSVPTI